jgi:hypothetical protein
VPFYFLLFTFALFGKKPASDAIAFAESLLLQAVTTVAGHR